MRQNVPGNVPWYLDGLDPDTRDAAREAARRAGVSLDEWLHATISDRAARAFADAPQPVRRRAAPPPAPVQGYDDLDAVSSRISRVTRGRGSQPQQRGYEAPARGVDAIVAAVGAEAERKTRESAARTAEALDSVARWIERAEDRMSESTRVLSEGTRMALERQDRAANVLGEALALMTKRLDDIERKVVEGREPSIAAALQAVGKIETQLSRLDEGQERRGDSAPRSAEVENALRGFEQRIATIAERLSQANRRDPARPAAAPAAAPAPASRSDDMIEALRADVARLSSQLQSVSVRGDVGAETATHLRRSVDDLAGRVDALATRDDLAELENTLRDLSREAAQAARSGREDDLARIDALVERVEGEIGRIAAEAANGAYENAGRDYAALSRKIDDLSATDHRLAASLGRDLDEVRATLARLAEPERLAELQEQVRDLSQRVGHLSRSQITAIDFAGLRGAVEEIRGSVRAAQAGLDGRITQIAAGLHDLPERLPKADFGAVERQYDTIVERLASLSESQPKAEISRLADAVAGMAERLEGLSASTGRRETELLSRELAAMAAGLVDLRDGAKASDVAALGARIDALADRFDALTDQRASADLSPVTDQLAALSAKLDAMRAQERPDFGEHFARLQSTIESALSATRSNGPGELDALMARIDQLDESLRAIDTRATDLRGGMRPIEDMLAQLARRLDAAERPNAAPETVDALEAQIEAIARRLESEREANVAAVADAARSAIAASLGAAPRSEGAGSGDIDFLARSLADIKEMHSLAQERGVEAVGGVQNTLDKLVERLASLEQRMQAGLQPQARRAAQAGKPVAQSAPQASLRTAQPAAAKAGAHAGRQALSQAAAQAAPQAPAQASAQDSAEVAANLAAKAAAPRPAAPAARASFGPEMTPSRLLDLAKAQAGLAVSAPALSLQDEADRPVATVGSLGDDVLLEPGSGRPRPRAEAGAEDPAQIKASFIAAARRAAQNAAAEAAAASRKAPALDARGASARPAAADKAAAVGGSRRRPLLMAAAAVVLAIGAFQIGSTIVGEGETGGLAGEPRGLADSVLADAAIDDETSAGAEVAALETALPAPAPALAAPQDAAALDPRDWAAPETTASIARVLEAPEEPAIIGMDDLAPLPAAPGFAGEAAGVGAAPALPPRRTPLDAATVGQQAVAAALAAIEAPSAAPAASPARAGKIFPSMLSPDEIPAGMGPEELRRAALAGDVDAVYEFASRAAEGRDMNRDPALAAKLFERAAAHGLVPAQFRIGNHYEKGIGVTRDFSLATLWYQRAAESGNARAMHNLAVLLAEGVNGSPDDAAALGWFRRAAEHGIRDSQFNLAVLLARGLGGAQDLSESYVWFDVAARQGDEDAAAKRDEVASRLDERALAMARAKSESWRPEAPRPEANEVAFPTPTSSPVAPQAGRPAQPGAAG